jgi:hypothetical protein
MTNVVDITPAPVSTTRNDMSALQNYIKTTNDDKEISIIEILRLSGAFHLDRESRFRENGVGNRTFQECFPSEEYFIAWVRYNGITADKKTILRRKYYEFVDQQNNQPQPTYEPQQNDQRGGKRRRSKTRRRNNKSSKSKTRRNKRNNRRRR